MLSINLPASKSECNRALIIQALYHYQKKQAENKENDSNLHHENEKIIIQNISNARDTQILLQILGEIQQNNLPQNNLSKNNSSQKDIPNNNVWDVQDAGTTMRFLTAFACVTAQHCTLTGTARMQERPIGILVEALQTLGFGVDYQKNQNFPPIIIKNTIQNAHENPSKTFAQKTEKISMRGDVSSQFISALLLIAPLLPLGLELELLGKVASKPYIEMTLAQMAHFGIQYQWEANRICVKNQPYLPKNYVVEGDWSGASYWFALTAIRGKPLFLKNLKENSLQGDKIIMELMQDFGVMAEFGYLVEMIKNKINENEISNNNEKEDSTNKKVGKYDGFFIKKQENFIQKQQKNLFFDCKNCPDLAQTLFVVCGALGKKAKFIGLESLKIKETDRLNAMQTELAKFGIILTETQTGEAEIHLHEDSFLQNLFPLKNPDKIIKIFPPEKIVVNTYHDHRMAMAFAPLLACVHFEITSPEVVAKSYPHFWDEWAKIDEDFSQNFPVFIKKNVSI